MKKYLWLFGCRKMLLRKFSYEMFDSDKLKKILFDFGIFITFVLFT